MAAGPDGRASRRKLARGVCRHGSAADKADRTTAVGQHHGAGWRRETIGRCGGRRSGERVIVSVGVSRRGEGSFRHGVSARNRSAASATTRRAAAETEGGVSARGALVRRKATTRASHIAKDRRRCGIMRFSQATPRPASEQPQCGQHRTDDGRSDHSSVTALACKGRRREAQGVERSTERATNTGALFEPAQLRGIGETAVATAEDRS